MAGTAASTRARLIDTAVALFYERGFQAVGLDQILDRVGITKTAFYKHFESKDDLIVAVLEKRDGEDIAELIASMHAKGGNDPRARLLALFDHLDEWFRQPSFRGCLFMNAATEFPSASDPIHKAAAAHGEHMASLVHTALVQLGCDAPEPLMQQIMLLVGGAVAARHVNGQLDAASSAKSVVETLLERAVTTRAPAARAS